MLLNLHYEKTAASFLNSRLKLWIEFEDLRVHFKEFHNKGPAIRIVHLNKLVRCIVMW